MKKIALITSAIIPPVSLIFVSTSLFLKSLIFYLPSFFIFALFYRVYPSKIIYLWLFTERICYIQLITNKVCFESRFTDKNVIKKGNLLIASKQIIDFACVLLMITSIYYIMKFANIGIIYKIIFVPVVFVLVAIVYNLAIYARRIVSVSE